MKGNRWGLSRQIFVSVWLMCWGGVTITSVTAAPISGITNQVQKIDFRRDGKGRGVLTLKLQRPQSLVDFRRQGKQLQLDIFDTQLTNEQIHTLDVVDFATVVNSIDTSNIPRGARLVFHLAAGYDYDYRLRGNNLEVTITQRVQPKSTSTAAQTKVSYQGKPISINFQDIPVRNVLQLIADYNDFNLVVADTVSGNVTLRLDNVPWPQVLDIILQAKGLDKRVRGSVLLVAPKTELAANDHQVMETARKQQQLASLRSKLIQINYAKATDIAELLRGASDGIGMLSERGSLHVDERTNALIIKDTPESITSIKEIVVALDIPVKQVQIEARIVTIDEGNIDELGVRWGVSSIDGDTAIGGSIEGNLGSSGLLDDTTVDDFLNVNLGATQGGLQVSPFKWQNWVMYC